jgi:GH15 family glucan-1,4-alpha-glucosidase
MPVGVRADAAPRIEDYALIGDCHTAALVSRDGSIDWLCLPRFDSGACFAALVGTPDNGRWRIAPCAKPHRVSRRYRGETLVLESDFETEDGLVSLIDFMPLRGSQADLVRLVVGKRGRVAMEMDLAIRFDYGWIVPWVRKQDGGIVAVAGPETVHVSAEVPLRGEDMRTVARFDVQEGQTVAFVLTWHRSHLDRPGIVDARAALRETEESWKEWAAQCTYDGEWREAVVRSLVVLKGLTYSPTGGMVAAPTTSLPEQAGGVRNWDYRFCWLRDATFTLYALLMNGYREEARAWREWLLRAVAGKPSQLNILYGIAGERRIQEAELTWLAGYQGARPVRTGNRAHEQFQLDVFGEVADVLHLGRRMGLDASEDGWRVERALLDFLESRWEDPDEGIWEVRGGRRHFTHSKMMAWVAVDRAVKDAEAFGLDGPLDRWRALRERIHRQTCERAFDAGLGSFVQYYGAKTLDASLLMMPLVGFLPPADPRVQGTLAAIERHLLDDGFVQRYLHDPEVDGLPPGEGAFLLCTFWLVDNYHLAGRRDEARALFERLLSIRNDVGLLAEEYDPSAHRFLGNFPQAFSHIGLVNTARNLSTEGPAKDRPRE